MTSGLKKIAGLALRRFNYYSDPVFWDVRLGRNNAGRFAETWARLNESIPLSAIKVVRWPRLKHLIERAAEDVVLYAEEYARNGVSPRDIRSEEDLCRLPAIKKTDFKRYLSRHRDHSHKNAVWRAKEGLTSGSTGEPFRFFLDDAYSVERVAMGNRIWRWAGVEVQAPKILCAPESARNYYPNLVFLHPHFIQERKEDYINTIRASGARLIFGSPLMTFDLLRTIEEAGVNDIAFDVAVLGGHAVAPGLRKYFKERFGCEVFEFYAAGETRMIGIECEAHRGLHLQEETAVVEVVDERGLPLPLGKIGRVLVTSLNNQVMPFIRYDIGDIGVMLPGECPCGRTSRRIFVEGRTNEGLLVTPDGESLSPAVLRDILDAYFESFQRYQLVQTALQKFTLSLVPTNTYTPAMEREIAAKIKKAVGGSITLTINRRDSIPPLPSGKFQYFVSNLWKKKFSPALFATPSLDERVSRLPK